LLTTTTGCSVSLYLVMMLWTAREIVGAAARPRGGDELDRLLRLPGCGGRNRARDYDSCRGQHEF
jgi:hypothetical protein